LEIAMAIQSADKSAGRNFRRLAPDPFSSERLDRIDGEIDMPGRPNGTFVDPFVSPVPSAPNPALLPYKPIPSDRTPWTDPPRQSPPFEVDPVETPPDAWPPLRTRDDRTPGSSLSSNAAAGFMVPQSTQIVKNLTTHALRMKGVPEADIGAAINDPARMKDLLNRYYGRPPVIPTGGDSSGFGNKDGRDASNYQPGQAPTASAATPDTYLPFGWAGLPALQR
jgi:hypothetical protein